MAFWFGGLKERPFLTGSLILGLAFLLRLPGLMGRPLWYDEAFAVLFSSKGLPAMVQGTLHAEAGVAADVHPLLYYSLLGLWQKAFGGGVLSVRSLSLLLGLFVVAVGYGLARRSLGPRAALSAGVLLAASPFQVHYAQEVRMYVLMTLLLLACTWAFWEARTGGGIWAWILFATFAALAEYAHNLAAFYLVPLGLIPWLEKDWRVGVRTVGAGLVALALYLPWLLFLPSQVARLRWAYWIEQPGPAELLRTLITFLADRPLPSWTAAVLGLALFCSLLTLGVLAWHLGRSVAGDAGRTAAREFGWLAIAPAALLFAVSWLQPVYLDRALLPSAAACTLALAWLLTLPRVPLVQKFTVTAAVGASTVIGLLGFYAYRGFPHAPFVELDQYLRGQLTSGEVILHSNKITALPAVYYDPTLPHRYLADPAGSASDTLALPTQRVLGWIADIDAASAARDQSGVWFVQFRQERDDYRELGFVTPPPLDWLERNFEQITFLALGDLEITHFRVADSDQADG